MKTKMSRFMMLVAMIFSTLTPSTVAQAAQETGAPALLQFTAGGHALGFTPQGIYASSGSHALHVDFLGANNIQPQAGIASNPSTLRQAQDGVSLRTGAATNTATTQSRAVPLSSVTYAGLWEGITLTYHATPGSIYTTVYLISPGANAKNIRLRYNAPLTINHNGTLNIAFQSGAMTESAPIAWQDIEGQRKPVDVSFRVQGQEVTFALGGYDPGHALTIDPSLVWNTFLGGSGDDYGTGIAVDGDGNVYVTGYSNATWGSPVRAFTSSFSNPDAFAAKLDSSGNLAWNTFLGGSGGDYGEKIAVDGIGNIYVMGYSSGSAWGCSPTTCTVRAYTNIGGQDAFVAKLDSSGNLTWNTFLGGSGVDSGWGIAVGGGNVYVAGSSPAAWGCSPTACTVRAYAGDMDAFVAKLDSSGNLTWNTFLGGSGGDYGTGIAVDGGGDVYVTGQSSTAWGWSLVYPPVRAYTVGIDAFTSKLDSSGNIQWSTFLGGGGNDYSASIAADGNRNLYVTGQSSTAWSCSPTACTVQTYTGGVDAFVAKLDSASGGLTWNAFLGSAVNDFGIDIAVDGNGNVYATGFSFDTWGTPVRAYTAAEEDAFAAKLDSSGNLKWNTFLGGGGSDYGNGIGVDGNGNVYLVGFSSATWDSPVQAFAGGLDDAFAAKVDFSPSVVYIISGNAGVPNATLTSTGGSATADDSGNYSLSVTSGWTGTVTPSKPGYTFSPVNRPYANVQTDQTAQNYTATPITYTIAGNAGVAGANLSYTDGTPKNVTADGSGNYTVTVPYGWTGTITPWKSGAGFAPANWMYMNVTANQSGKNYTFYACATTDATIAGSLSGSACLTSGQSTRQSYAGLNNGPVKFANTSSMKIIASERLLYYTDGTPVSFVEMLGLPNSQLGSTYWLPWYKNIPGDIDTQLRLGNVSGTLASVHVYIGGVEMAGSPFSLTASGAGQSTRLNFAGVNDGPVKVVSDVNVVASERLLYYANGTPTSFSEMLGVPNSQLSTMYWLPWYKNIPGDIDTQLRLGNVSGAPASVHVYIGGVEMTGSPFSLTASGAGQSTRLSFAGVNAGPVKVVSNVNVVVSERLLYFANGVPTSFVELPGLPNSQLSATWWLPWYKNVAGEIDTQLRLGNVSGSPAIVHVYIGGAEMTGSPFSLTASGAGQSTRLNFDGVNAGPVQVVSNVNVVASERLLYYVKGVPTSFSEMLGVPNSQLNSTWWLPWYKNTAGDIDTQLRFAMP